MAAESRQQHGVQQSEHFRKPHSESHDGHQSLAVSSHHHLDSPLVFLCFQHNATMQLYLEEYLCLTYQGVGTAVAREVTCMAAALFSTTNTI